jgi:N-acetyl-anhydromuramyl-L-alanine amidase AmpD
MDKYNVIECWATSKGRGRSGSVPKVVVLHHTGGNGNVDAEVGYLQNNPRGVSIHVCITKDGTRYRMVRDEDTAYHCGYSRVGSLGSANNVTLGIELINRGTRNPPDEYPIAQIDSCAEQVAEWLSKYDSIQMITPHAAIDTQGKVDPYNFPWRIFWEYIAIYLSGTNTIITE